MEATDSGTTRWMNDGVDATAFFYSVSLSYSDLYLRVRSKRAAKCKLLANYVAVVMFAVVFNTSQSKIAIVFDAPASET